MGRWAQRRLGNGGGGSGPAPILITSAVVNDFGTGEVQLEFSGDIDALDFSGPDFEVMPSAVGASSLSQAGPTTLIVTWGFDITGETDMTYSGTAPNVSTPQTVPLT